MKNSKLIQILQTFSAKDHRLFSEFLASPIFNKNEDLGQLYAHLRKLAPRFSSKKVERAKVWKAVFPERNFDDKDMYYLMSFLLNHALDFISLQAFRDDPFLPNYFTLESCEQRGLQKHYQNIQKRIAKDREEHPYHNQKFFYQEFTLSSLEGRAFGKSRQRTTDDAVQSVSKNLDYFYLISKLRIACEMVNRHSFLSENYDSKLVNQVLNLCDNSDLEPIFFTTVYACILRMLTESENESHFQQLKSLLGNDPLSGMDRNDMQEIFVYAQNYCISRIRGGHAEYLQELFLLYQKSGENGLLIGSDGYISPWRYKNIISVGIRLAEFTATEEFIETYRSFLPLDYQKDAYHYNIAHLAFGREDYKKALQNLLEVNFTDVFYSLDTKKMLMKIYFKQGEIEAFYSLVASFRIFLTRNELISDQNRLSYKNFIRLAYAMFKLKYESKGSREEISKLLDEVEALVDEDWIREELERV